MTEHPSELGKEIMATLYRIANRAHARLGFASAGRLQAKTHPPGPFLSWAITVGPIGLRTRQAAEIEAWDARLGRRRLYYQGVPHVLGLTAIVGLAPYHYDS